MEDVRLERFLFLLKGELSILKFDDKRDDKSLDKVKVKILITMNSFYFFNIIDLHLDEALLEKYLVYKMDHSNCLLLNYEDSKSFTYIILNENIKVIFTVKDIVWNDVLLTLTLLEGYKNYCFFYKSEYIKNLNWVLLIYDNYENKFSIEFPSKYHLNKISKCTDESKIPNFQNENINKFYNNLFNKQFLIGNSLIINESFFSIEINFLQFILHYMNKIEAYDFQIRFKSADDFTLFKKAFLVPHPKINNFIINLQKGDLSDDDLLFYNQFSKVYFVKTIRFSLNQLDDNAFFNIVELFTLSSFLIEIDISFNFISGESLAYLSRYFTKDNRLKYIEKLYFNNNWITSSYMKEFFENVFLNLKFISSINLSGNYLDNDCLFNIDQFLRNNKVISKQVVIDLRDNNFDNLIFRNRYYNWKPDAEYIENTERKYLLSNFLNNLNKNPNADRLIFLIDPIKYKKEFLNIVSYMIIRNSNNNLNLHSQNEDLINNIVIKAKNLNKSTNEYFIRKSIIKKLDLNSLYDEYIFTLKNNKKKEIKKGNEQESKTENQTKQVSSQILPNKNYYNEILNNKKDLNKTYKNPNKDYNKYFDLDKLIKYFFELSLNKTNKGKLEFKNITKLENTNIYSQIVDINNIVNKYFSNNISNSTTNINDIKLTNYKFNPQIFSNDFYTLYKEINSIQISKTILSLNLFINQIKIESNLVLKDKNFELLKKIHDVTIVYPSTYQDKISYEMIKSLIKVNIIQKSLMDIINFEGFSTKKDYFNEVNNYLDLFITEIDNIGFSSELIIVSKYIQYIRNNNNRKDLFKIFKRGLEENSLQSNIIENNEYDQIFSIYEKHKLKWSLSDDGEVYYNDDDHIYNYNLFTQELNVDENFNLKELSLHPSNLEYHKIPLMVNINELIEDLKLANDFIIKTNISYSIKNIHDRISFILSSTSDLNKDPNSKYFLHKENNLIKIVRIIFRYINRLDDKDNIENNSDLINLYMGNMMENSQKVLFYKSDYYTAINKERMKVNDNDLNTTDPGINSDFMNYLIKEEKDCVNRSFNKYSKLYIDIFIERYDKSLQYNNSNINIEMIIENLEIKTVNTIKSITKSFFDLLIKYLYIYSEADLNSKNNIFHERIYKTIYYIQSIYEDILNQINLKNPGANSKLIEYIYSEIVIILIKYSERQLLNHDLSIVKDVHRKYIYLNLLLYFFIYSFPIENDLKEVIIQFINSKNSIYLTYICYLWCVSHLDYIEIIDNMINIINLNETIVQLISNRYHKQVIKNLPSLFEITHLFNNLINRKNDIKDFLDNIKNDYLKSPLFLVKYSLNIYKIPYTNNKSDVSNNIGMFTNDLYYKSTITRYTNILDIVNQIEKDDSSIFSRNIIEKKAFYINYYFSNYTYNNIRLNIYPEDNILDLISIIEISIFKQNQTNDNINVNSNYIYNVSNEKERSIFNDNDYMIFLNKVKLPLIENLIKFTYERRLLTPIILHSNMNDLSKFEIDMLFYQKLNEFLYFDMKNFRFDRKIFYMIGLVFIERYYEVHKNILIKDAENVVDKKKNSISLIEIEKNKDEVLENDNENKKEYDYNHSNILNMSNTYENNLNLDNNIKKISIQSLPLYKNSAKNNVKTINNTPLFNKQRSFTYTKYIKDLKKCIPISFLSQFNNKTNQKAILDLINKEITFIISKKRSSELKIEFLLELRQNFQNIFVCISNKKCFKIQSSLILFDSFYISLSYMKITFIDEEYRFMFEIEYFNIITIYYNEKSDDLYLCFLLNDKEESILFKSRQGQSLIEDILSYSQLYCILYQKIDIFNQCQIESDKTLLKNINFRNFEFLFRYRFFLSNKNDNSSISSIFYNWYKKSNYEKNKIIEKNIFKFSLNDNSSNDSEIIYSKQRNYRSTLLNRIRKSEYYKYNQFENKEIQDESNNTSNSDVSESSLKIEKGEEKKEEADEKSEDNKKYSENQYDFQKNNDSLSLDDDLNKEIDSSKVEDEIIFNDKLNLINISKQSSIVITNESRFITKEKQV